MNLIPDQRRDSRNYWCTWNAQHPMWDIESEEDLRAFDLYKATEGGNVARSRMNQAALLENPGWATHFWPRDRGDLYLCLDDGWDVPAQIDAGTERWRFGFLCSTRSVFRISPALLQSAAPAQRADQECGLAGIGLVGGGPV